MKKKEKKVKYPNTMYVVKEDDGEGYYFLADDDPDSFEDGEVAIYQLVDVKQKKTTRTVSFQ